MDLLNADVQRRSRPILIRLTPDLYERLTEVAQSVGGGIATTCRAILETALREGVNVVNSTEEIRAPKRGTKRRREDAQATA
jgi:predicted DNA-binding protein